MTSQNKGKYKICKGEKCLQNSCHFVKALLKLAYNLKTKTYDSEEVRVNWISDDTLEITGTSLDKKNKYKEGTKRHALWELVKRDIKNFPLDHIRNSIDLLKEVSCDKNEESSYTNTTYILEEDELPTKYQGIRKFKLKLKGKEETLQENLRYLKECIEKSLKKNFEYYIDENISIENKSTDPEKRIRKAADFLRSFDCVKQENDSRLKIVQDKMGIFPTEVKEKELEPWFIWRLTECMGDFERIKKITISIDLFVVNDFNHFWHKIGKYIGEENNPNHDNVINKLVELSKTQSIIIIINNFQNLYFNKQNSDSYGEKMFKFFSNLFQLFKSEENKKYLVIFLAEGQKKSPYKNKNQEYLNQINNYSPEGDIKELQFTNFLRGEIENWLIENERKLGEENFDANKGHEMMKYLLGQDSSTLLHEICQHVFKLENGISEVEPYWKNIA